MIGRGWRVGAWVLAVTTAAAAQPAPEPALAPPPGEAIAAEIDDWDKEVSDYDKLRTPDSPAFVILGAAPTEIQRPTTPRGLVAALGGLVTGGDLTVPRNVAIEFAPYWLFAHPSFTVAKYRGQALLRPLRTLSLSIGTAATRRTEDTGAGATVEHTDTDIGIGFRTMLFQRGDEDRCTRAANELGVRISELSLTTHEDRQQALAAGPLRSPAYDAALDDIARAKAPALAAVRSQLAVINGNDKCVALAASTTGFSIGLAGAIDVRSADSRLTRAATSLAGYALWTNLSYDTRRFSGIVVARVDGRTQDMTTQHLADAGIRAIYKQKTYAVSAEGLARHRFTDDADATTYKADIALEYEISGDHWLSVTFGKDFSFVPGEAGGLFSLANLQWGIGKAAR